MYVLLGDEDVQGINQTWVASSLLEENREVARWLETLGGTLSLALGIIMCFLSSEGISCQFRQNIICILHESGSPIQDAGWGVAWPQGGVQRSPSVLVGTCYAALEIQNPRFVSERLWQWGPPCLAPSHYCTWLRADWGEGETGSRMDVGHESQMNTLSPKRYHQLKKSSRSRSWELCFLRRKFFELKSERQRLK